MILATKTNINLYLCTVCLPQEHDLVAEND